MKDEQLAKGLGWFSIGLGMAELLAPRKVGALIGVADNQRTIQTLGVREIATGVAILRNPENAGWVWSRVAGDAVDLGLLAAAFSSERTNKGKLAAAITTVAGVTALDILASTRLSKNNGSQNGYHKRFETARYPVRKSITINRTPEAIYTFWRKLENLPTFMSHLKEVKDLGEGKSHWVAKGPAGMDAQWDAEIVEDIPNESISWRSLPGSTVENSGRVYFEEATGKRGTVVRVELRYNPPAGKIGATIAKLFGEAPEKQIPVDLMRLRQLLETGEVATTEGQPAGRSHSTSRIYDDWLRS